MSVLVPAPFSAQTIADAARQERERRQQLSKRGGSVGTYDSKSPAPPTVAPPNVSTPRVEATAPPGTSAATVQIADAPNAYSLTSDNSALAPGLVTKIYRSGTKAAIDQVMPGLQSRTVFDLSTRRSYTWSLSDRSVPCRSGSFSGDWGDPFVAAAHLKADMLNENAKDAGTATINGIETRVVKVQQFSDEATLWLERKSGLIVKAEARVNGQRKPMIEVKQLSFSPPPENVFNLPASCQSR
jgi:hypothetical protein